MRNTKIVATLGPASDTPEITGKLIEAGAEVFRLNASHGTAEDRTRRIGVARAAAAEQGRDVGMLLDLQGPKIRLGKFENGGCVLECGQRFTITTEERMGNTEGASTTYAQFARDVKPGNRVLLADGSLELRVLSTDGVAAVCEVVDGGPVSDRKGINLPGVSVSSPSLTKKDMADLAATLNDGIDMVAMSFVRRREDMLRLRHFLEERDVTLPLIAKIEKPEALDNLDEIIDASDGVMVARGDLGVELPMEKVPSIQKMIIDKARAKGRFVITATQMLESMIEHPSPTRAEVSDVANAIFDGTDAVMLSAETGAGKHPVEAVRMMARIAHEAEASLPAWRRPESLPPAVSTPEIMADAAFRASRSLCAAAIVVFTTTGSSARLVARYRPPAPVYAFTASEAVARQLTAVFGVRAFVTPVEPTTDQLMVQMDTLLLNKGLVKLGDKVVFLAGLPVGRPGTTNLMRVHEVD